MNRTGWSMTLAAVMVSAVACTEGSRVDGDASASCAFRILYQDRAYRDVANVEFTVGRRLGAATEPACDDTGGDQADEPGTTVTAYEVDGVPPRVAIAVGDTPGEARFVAVYSGTELPPEVEKLSDGS
ncbi:DUF6281 family protein [Streptomyces sp. NPDC003470]|uniref:DUF6281 family protein n=1 Tax=unclassified Streptomyces TaxID=2593676 RepID=UPI00366647DA